MSKKTSNVKSIATNMALPSTLRAGDRDAIEKAMLRKQVADLQAANAQMAAQQQAAAWEAICADLTKRYAIGPTDKLNIETGEITRAAPAPAPKEG